MEPVAYIHSENLESNISILKEVVKKRVIYVVKADGYGHGLINIVNTIRKVEPAAFFAVARFSEAEKIIKHDSKLNVLLLSPLLDAYELKWCVDNGVHFILSGDSTFRLLCEYLGSVHFKNVKGNVWLKYNTGMNRLGLSENLVKTYYGLLKNSYGDKINLHLLSHLACSNKLDHYANELQQKCFLNLSDELKLPSSLYASGGTFLKKCKQDTDFHRLGLLLYGVSDCFEGAKDLKQKLLPVMSLHATIIEINQIKKGDFVGYNASWIARESTNVAVINIGYGDGYPQSSEGGCVQIADRLYPLIGSVNMDTITVDLGSNANCYVGQDVIIWGGRVKVEDVALQANTSPYELLTRVTNRVKRVLL
ncbi:alanine racemase [Pseudoalteromonas phenolica]|uniref:alanine racemase n=1 Tax=Pseudoalteromonas phenolica TaxID=161398 RepID=UPI0014873B84|nr:alanine racemase [Pseudoalteromonas phenolica]